MYQLETLDLSSNPIAILEDFIFKDLTSLKRLFIESTNIRSIYEFTFSGLVSLRELRLSKCLHLNWIDGRAFVDSKLSLKELHLKDTMIRISDTVDQDRMNGPFPKYPNGTWVNSTQEKTKKLIWFEGLELELLNMDSSKNKNEQLDLDNFGLDKQQSIMCKMYRYLSPNTLIHLKRNHSCNCLVYLVYRKRDFPRYSRWEFKAPYCYRVALNDNKNRSQIINRELECGLNSIDSTCFPVFIPTSTLITSRRGRSTYLRPLSHNDPSKSSIESKQKKFPKVDFKKLAKVIATIIAFTIFSVLITVLIYRHKNKFQRKRKESKSNRLKNNSISSSTQTTLNAIGISTLNKTQKKLVMPPSVIPPFNTKVKTSTQNSKSSTNTIAIKKNDSETKSKLKDEKNFKEAALLIMQEKKSSKDSET